MQMHIINYIKLMQNHTFNDSLDILVKIFM